MSEDNVILMHEYVTYKLNRDYGNRFDENSLILLYKAFRYILWHFTESLDADTVIGLEFQLQKDLTAKMFLVTNKQSYIEVRNKHLEKIIVPLFARKLVKDGKAFIHWNDILKHEEQLRHERQKI